MTKNHINRIFCTGISYKSTSLALREQLFLEKEQKESLYTQILEKKLVSEILILSTCNRLELYGILQEEKKDLSSPIDEIWEIILKKKNCFHTENKDKILFQTYHYLGLKAISHIFKVVTSIDSLCVGETQITGQFKQAFQETKTTETSVHLLKKIGKDALSLNKKIRTQTQLGKKNKSISHLAIDLSLHIFKTIEHKSVVLIGAGKMIELGYQYLLTHNPKSITIVNRTREKALKIIKNKSHSYALNLSKLEEAILQADIIVSSTSSESYLLDYTNLSKLQQKRNNQPLFIIDIALPRDIDPKCSTIENIYLFDLDDIRKIIKINNKNYEGDIRKAELLIEEKITQFEKWLNNIESNYVLNSFGSYLNDLFVREERRTLNKKNLKNISPEQKEAIHIMLQSISQKILSDTAISMKQTKLRNDDKIEIKLNRNLIGKRKKIG